MKYFIIFCLVLLNCNAFAFELWTNAEQGSLLIGKVQPTSKLYYNGKRIKTANNGRFMIALGRDAPKKITITEKKLLGTKQNHEIKVDARKWDIQRINGIKSSMVNPPASTIAKIQQDAADVRKAKSYSTTKYFPTCFIVPVTGARISGVFGSQRILNGEKKNYHGGIDYAAPKGKKVQATAKGRVAMVSEDMYYNGKTIIIDHGFGVFSSYLHLSRILVKKGDFVRQGENIGMIGSTGRSTGPHLHFGIDWNGVRIDPQTAISNRICKY